MKGQEIRIGKLLLLSHWADVLRIILEMSGKPSGVSRATIRKSMLVSERDSNHERVILKKPAFV